MRRNIIAKRLTRFYEEKLTAKANRIMDMYETILKLKDENRKLREKLEGIKQVNNLLICIVYPVSIILDVAGVYLT